jgi:hypothetical protein
MWWRHDSSAAAVAAGDVYLKGLHRKILGEIYALHGLILLEFTTNAAECRGAVHAAGRVLGKILPLAARVAVWMGPFFLLAQ